MVLAVLAGAFLLGLRFLRLDEGLPPEFCGFGSLKENSRVPPTVHVCGVSLRSSCLLSNLNHPRTFGASFGGAVTVRAKRGPSPYVRGLSGHPNEYDFSLRSIPVRSGSPLFWLISIIPDFFWPCSSCPCPAKRERVPFQEGGDVPVHRLSRFQP